MIIIFFINIYININYYHHHLLSIHYKIIKYKKKTIVTIIQLFIE